MAVHFDPDLERDLNREREDLARWEAEEAWEWLRDHPEWEEDRWATTSTR